MESYPVKCGESIFYKPLIIRTWNHEKYKDHYLNQDSMGRTRDPGLRILVSRSSLRRSQPPKLEQRQRWPPWDVPSRLVRCLWRRCRLLKEDVHRDSKRVARCGYQHFGGRYKKNKIGKTVLLVILDLNVSDSDTVDGWNPASTSWYGKYLIICDGFYTSQVVIARFLPSTTVL